MSRKNALTASPPLPVAAALKDLGIRLKAARLARNLTIEAVARRIGTGPRAVSDAEAGKPGASAGVFVALLWVYDLLEPFHQLADPATDQIAQSTLRHRERARGGKTDELDNDF
jgi:transcriptional regulator with XRE-family HTH domain